MTGLRTAWAFAALALATLASCGTDEERTVATWAELQIVRSDGVAELVHLEARWPEADASAGEFGRVWEVVAAGRAPVEAVAVTLTGGGDTHPDGVALLVGLALVIPTPIRAGSEWAVTGTRPPPGEDVMPLYWSIWGGRSLRTTDEAEIALRMFDYDTNTMSKANQLVATEVGGTLTVLARHDELVELALELDVVGAGGATATLSGTLRIWGEQYTPPA